jgi:nitrogen regulatory protein P-II 1
MKEIKAVVRPSKLDRINQVLRVLPGFPGLVVARVERSGPGGAVETGSIRRALSDYSEKVLIQIVCDDELVDAIVERIVEEATSGSVGLGLVWVTAVERTVFFNKTVGRSA